jgi:hypothetical protein
MTGSTFVWKYTFSGPAHSSNQNMTEFRSEIACLWTQKEYTVSSFVYTKVSANLSVENKSWYARTLLVSLASRFEMSLFLGISKWDNTAFVFNHHSRQLALIWLPVHSSELHEFEVPKKVSFCSWAIISCWPLSSKQVIYCCRWVSYPRDDRCEITAELAISESQSRPAVLKRKKYYNLKHGSTDCYGERIRLRVCMKLEG